jgi:hypothetical protein
MSEVEETHAEEQRLRRLAKRQGLIARKSRRRVIPGWYIIDAQRNSLESGERPISFDEAMAFVSE